MFPCLSGFQRPLHDSSHSRLARSFLFISVLITDNHLVSTIFPRYVYSPQDVKRFSAICSAVYSVLDGSKSRSTTIMSRLVAISYLQSRLAHSSYSLACSSQRSTRPSTSRFGAFMHPI